MELSVLSVGFASFIGGLLLVSRVARWITLIALASKRSASGQRSPVGVAPLVLHSGPWMLVLAVAGVYYVSVSTVPRPYLWALLIGFALACAFIGATTTVAVRRSRRPRREPEPLTPERLLGIRRRFFWRNSLLIGLTLPAWLAYSLYDEIRGLLPEFLIFGFFVTLPFSWLWSWFMWQWYGAELEANEKAREERRHEKKKVD